MIRRRSPRVHPMASRTPFQIIRRTVRHSPAGWAAACGIRLRPYQRHIARAVKDSILHGRGLTFVVILPRQSGKNELQAHLFSWLLFRYSGTGGTIVSVSPTFRPQTLICMERLRRSLSGCIISRDEWHSSHGFQYSLGLASIKFYSGSEAARVVGATADLLLSVDEAQEIPIAKFDRDFDPMTASTNATRLFFGTVWTCDTLLERQRRLALEGERQDGIQRVFLYTAEDVRRLVPAYGRHLDRAIAEHGRNDPRIRSQYFCEAIDAQSAMFPASRLSLLISPPNIGASRRGAGAGPNRQLFAFLIDVAGQDETPLDPLASTGLSHPGRDSTALTIVEIDLDSLKELERPTYHVRDRHSWIGQSHVSVFGRVKTLSEAWQPRHIVIDATGVGEGLWSMLDRRYRSRVVPVKFTSQQKSEIGWQFLSIVDTGRFRDHCHTEAVGLQYAHCQFEILPGPGKILRWGVPEGTRGPDGALIHDDFLLADSLVARLDRLEWRQTLPTTILAPRPPSEKRPGGLPRRTPS
jgi:hypothetical protein